jgi:uroporphyrinogen decarboxylase
MTHRDRVTAVFDHRKPDRVPRDLGSTIWSTMDGVSYGKLKRHLGIEKETSFRNIAFQAVNIDEEILQLFDIDFRGMTTAGPAGWQDEISAEGIYIDEWGIRRNVHASAAIVCHPLAVPEYGHEFLERYPWPDGTGPGRFAGFPESFERLHAEGEYATVLNVFGGFTTMSYLLRGMDNWCIDMLTDEELFTDLLDRTLKFEMDSARTALAAFGSSVDIVAIADDLAGQDGLLISPHHFRKLVKPRMEQLIAAIREDWSGKVVFHCCGSVADIIPDFIELGIDALNPLQVSARGMDPKELHARYGGSLVFWGGIDSQQLLPNGTPQEVADEVGRITAAMEGMGYVLGAVHNVQGDVPPENVTAIFSGT